MCLIFNILQFEKAIFCNSDKGYKKKNDQDIVRLVAGNKGVEYTPLKIYEKETRS